MSSSVRPGSPTQQGFVYARPVDPETLANVGLMD